MSIVVVSAGILVTTSGQGLFILALCWGIWCLRGIKTRDFKKLVGFLIVLIVLLSSYDFDRTIGRIITQDELNAIDARSGGYLMISQLDESQLLFGVGYGNYDEEYYYSSFAEIIFCLGYFGLALVVLMYLVAFFRGRTYQKILVLSSLFAPSTESEM